MGGGESCGEGGTCGEEEGGTYSGKTLNLLEFETRILAGWGIVSPVHPNYNTCGHA